MHSVKGEGKDPALLKKGGKRHTKECREKKTSQWLILQIDFKMKMK